MTKYDSDEGGSLASVCGICGCCALIVSVFMLMVLPSFFSDLAWPIFVFGIISVVLGFTCGYLKLKLKRKRRRLRRGKRILQLRSSMPDHTPIKPVSAQITQPVEEVPLFCPTCGKKLSKNVKFCEDCGAEVS